MLKSGCFKVQVQLTTEKGRNFLPSLTDRELGLTDRKSQHSFPTEFLNRPKPTKTFRVSSKLLHI